MPETVSDGLFDVPEATSLTERAQGGSVAAPLAVRMRPASLDEVVGQDHLLQPGSPLRRLVEGSGVASVILYGPPGSGKTTLAALISQGTGRRFEALSALSAGVKEVRAVIDVARRAAAHGEQTVLFIDEVHRFSKTQQDALLSAVENRVVLLVAATTENPSFSVVAPLLSRSSDPAAAPAERRRHPYGGAARDRRPARAERANPGGVRCRRPTGAAGSRGRAPRADRAGGRGRGGGAGDRRGHRAVPGQSRGPLRPRRRSALRRHQRVHQVGARVRRRRRVALPGQNAGRR